MLIGGELSHQAEAEEHYDFDLFVIGAGSGGVRASRFSASHGAKVSYMDLFWQVHKFNFVFILMIRL